MLKFFKNQLAVQGILTTFLAIYPQEYTNKLSLVALTNLQIERLTFLIRELEGPPYYPPETSMKVWEEYNQAYSDQQILLSLIVNPEHLTIYLPTIVFPSAQVEEEILGEGTIEFQPLELRDPYSNIRLSENYTGYSPQPLLTTPTYNRDNSFVMQSGLSTYAASVSHEAEAVPAIIDSSPVASPPHANVRAEPLTTFFSPPAPLSPILKEEADSVALGSLSTYPSASFFPASEKSDQRGNSTGDKYMLYAERLKSLKTKRSQEAFSPEEKIEVRLLSNKLSAHDSRTRKKEHIRALEESLKENTNKNKELQEQCTRLLAEQRTLKELLANLVGMFTSIGINADSLLAQIPMAQAMTTSGSLEEEQEASEGRFSPD